MAYSCPVCHYPKLVEPPRSPSGGGSYEICPSCGFEFGVSDDDQGHTYASWLARWKSAGCPWQSKSRPAPARWSAAAQLKAGLPAPAPLRKGQATRGAPPGPSKGRARGR